MVISLTYGGTKHAREAISSWRRLPRRAAAVRRQAYHQATGRPSERRTVDHCQRAAPAHPDGRAGSLPRSARGPDRPQGQPWHDCAAGLRAFLGVARLHGRDSARGVGGGIVAYNRRRYGRLSHITEAQDAWHPDRTLTKREKCLLPRG